MDYTTKYTIPQFRTGFPIEPLEEAPAMPFERIQADETLAMGKDAAKEEFKEISKELRAYQELLYAENKHKVLFVLQAMDTAGKDNTIEKVFGPLNPQCVKSASFKKPSAKELAHDYLHRIHQHVPATRQIGIFNRSHYEDIIWPHVHGHMDENMFLERCEDLRNFEQYLNHEGVHIRKIYLHITKEKQREKLQARIDNPDKRWKFSKGDLEERKLWDTYMNTYQRMIMETSTENAPWLVIPSNFKWTRNYIVGKVATELFESLNMDHPPAPKGIENIIVE